MRVRDMDPKTLRHLARELDRDAAHWGRACGSVKDHEYAFHAARTKGLADYYRKRAALAERAQQPEP